jgi:hypothetical protein
MGGLWEDLAERGSSRFQAGGAQKVNVGFARFQMHRVAKGPKDWHHENTKMKLRENTVYITEKEGDGCPPSRCSEHTLREV